MLNLMPTFVWVAINLFVLYIILRRILFKPVTQFMENRAKSIKDAIADAEANKAEAAALRHKYEDQLGIAGDKAEEILNDVRVKANKEYESIIATAWQHADEIKARAQEDIERERARITKDIRNMAVGLALAAASKIIEANMDTAGNRKLVEKFLNEEGAA